MIIFRAIKKLIKIAIYLVVIILIVAFIPIVTGVTKCAMGTLPVTSAAPVNKAIPANIKSTEASLQDYQRPESHTFLTFPAWYIVFSSQEYAQYIKDHAPSGFPFFSSIQQYWFGYCTAYRVTRNQYQVNWGDHLKLIARGSSMSAGYAIKGAYENTLGWLSEWSSSNELVEEDHYAAKVAQEYADFIPYHPWYEFSYMHSLYGLWTETSFNGPHVFRKWERKIILSIEYSIKAADASLVEMAASSAYGAVHPGTYVLIKNVPDSVFTTTYKNNAKVKMVKKINAQEYIAMIPHGQEFTDIVPELAKSGVQFEDAAGNSMILVTAVTPPGWSATLNEGTILFTMDILTQPDSERIAIQVPVDQLSALLQQLTNSGAEIEHVYDY